MLKDFFRIEKMDLLVSLYIFCIAATELMGAKTVPIIKLFGYQLNGSVSLLVLPLVYTINDVIVEVHGSKRARSIVRSGLLVVLGIFIMSVVSTNLPPSTRFRLNEVHYDAIFGLSARISAASLIAFALAEFLDVYIFSRMRKTMGKKALWLRNNVSNFASEFIDTGVFMVLAFYALDRSAGSNLAFLTSLIIPYWLLKCFMSIIETPFVYLGVSWLKDKK